MFKELIEDQRVKYAEAFKSIKHNVSIEDRKEAIKEFGLDKPALSSYLNGKRIYNVDKADKLLSFFLERIKARATRLASFTN